MDPTTLLILGGLALAVLVAALFALNRSWSNFPDRAGRLPPPGSSAPGMSSQLWELPHVSAAEQATSRPSSVEEASQAGTLVLIEQPILRRAAEQALQRGDPMTRYIVRDGDQIYLSFDRVSDPAQRQAAYELMRRAQAGEEVDLRALLRLVGQLSKGEIGPLS